MKLIVGIVHSDDAPGLVRALASEGYRSTTISTTGGFLREGNATVLVGTPPARVDAVLSTIRDSCRARSKWVSPPPLTETGELYASEPTEVQIGGATVFVLDVERMERF